MKICIFSTALVMQITKRALSQFLDDFQANIFNKQPGEVKIKVSIFMEVTTSMTSLCGFWLSLVGGDYPFWNFFFFFWNCPSLDLGWSTQKRLVTNYRGHSPPTKSDHHLQKPQCKCQIFVWLHLSICWIFCPQNNLGFELRSFSYSA